MERACAARLPRASSIAGRSRARIGGRLRRGSSGHRRSNRNRSPVCRPKSAIFAPRKFAAARFPNAHVFRDKGVGAGSVPAHLKWPVAIGNDLDVTAISWRAVNQTEVVGGHHETTAEIVSLSVSPWWGGWWGSVEPDRLSPSVFWRKEWDSNPRWTCAHGGFQDRCLKPLGHLSIGAGSLCPPAPASNYRLLGDGTSPSSARARGAIQDALVTSVRLWHKARPQGRPVSRRLISLR